MVGFAETHISLKEYLSNNFKEKFQNVGRRVYPAHATPTANAGEGTSGGTLIAPALSLQLAPISLDDNKDSLLKGDDWSAIVIRTQGVSYLFVAAYLIHTIGVTGENLRRLRSIATCAMQLQLPFIIAADWNMTPAQLCASGYVSSLGADVRVVEGLDYTCNTGRNLDYIIVSKEFSSAVRSVKPSQNTPWRTHRGLEIEVSKRPREIHVRKLCVPKPLVEDRTKLKSFQERPKWEEFKNKKEYKVDSDLRELLKPVFGGNLLETTAALSNDYLSWSSQVEDWTINAIEEESDEQSIEAHRFRKGRAEPLKFSLEPLVHWTDQYEAGAASKESRLWAIAEARIVDYQRTAALNPSPVHIQSIRRHLDQICDELADLDDGDSPIDNFEKKLFINKLRRIDIMQKQVVKELITIARKREKQADRAHRSEVAKKVRCWANEAMDSHCKNAHAYLRKADSPSIVGVAEDLGDYEISFEPQISCATKSAAWECIWQRDKQEIERISNAIQELRELASRAEHHMEAIEFEETDAAIKELRNGRSVGGDVWSPLDWKRLPPEARRDLTSAFRKSEKKIAVPMQALINLMALLPKPSGGERTVALQSLWHVVWSSIRGQKVRDWDSDRAQFWDSAIKGASAEQAGTLRKLIEEIAVLCGRTTISIFWDVKKFYDSIDIAKMIQYCIKKDYNIHIAAIDLQVHLGLRFLKWAGSTSQAIVPYNSLLAGSIFSNSYARTYLYDLLDELHSGFPKVMLGVHVDDLATLTEGEDVDDIYDSIKSAAKYIKDSFRQRKLQISDKTVIVSSKPSLAKKLCKELNELQIPATHALQVRDLGIDNAAGGRRATKVTMARALKAARRLRRLRIIHRYDKRASKLYRTNLWPAASYGIGATGIAPTSIKTLRRQAGQAALGRSGQCSTSAIAIQFREGTDPAAKVRCHVITQWIKIWLKLDDDKREEANSIWARQYRRLVGYRRWSLVNGPLRAAIATLLDVGWKPIAPDTWLEPAPSDQMWKITGYGDLRRFQQTISQSAMQEHWLEADSHLGGKGLGNTDPVLSGPDLHSLKRRLKSYEDNGMTDRHAALLTAASGACWPRSRKFNADMIGSEICPRCGQEAEDLLHFFWKCPCNVELQHEDIQRTQHLVQAACADINHQALWLRGLPPKAKYPPVPPAPEEEVCYTYGDSDSFTAAQKFYTDGSGGARTKDKRLRRCGWSAITADLTDPLAPELTSGFFGPLAGPEQSVPRSELHAVLFVLEATQDKEVWVVSDSKYVVDLARSRRSKSLQAPNGDLWQRYWTAYDLKGGRVKVSKVKAHCDATDVLNGIVTWQDLAGNSFADTLAEEAAEAHQVPYAVTSAFDVLDAIAWKVQSRLAEIICAAPTRNADERAAKEHKKNKAEAEQARLRQIEEEALRLLLADEVAAETPEPAPPPPPPRVGESRSRNIHPSHRLRKKRGIFWCAKCGGYGQVRGRKLAEPCRQYANETGKEVLRRLANGLTPHRSVGWEA